jgi:hypothetical protein
MEGGVIGVAATAVQTLPNKAGAGRKPRLAGVGPELDGRSQAGVKGVRRRAAWRLDKENRAAASYLRVRVRPPPERSSR